MNRTSTIKIGHLTGPKFNLETGVPQGVCLSPTLFNIYVHDISKPLPNTDYIQYADDITQIIAVPGPPNVISQNTSHAIEQLTRYDNKWKIQTNIHKFQTLNIARRTTHPIITDEQIMPYTNKATVLGLTFSTQTITPQITARSAIDMMFISFVHIWYSC